MVTPIWTKAIARKFAPGVLKAPIGTGPYKITKSYA